MLVAFVDVDGVLRHLRTAIESKGESNGLEIFDPENVRLLNKLVEKTSCQFVVSSTLRIINDLPSVRAIFRRNNVEREVLDVVPYGPPPGMPQGRGSEIHSWLMKHPEVGAFVILDDEVSDMHHLRPWAVHVENGYFSGGLKGYHVNQALRILSLPLPSSYAIAYSAGLPNHP
jgi:hypothetical protein